MGSSSTCGLTPHAQHSHSTCVLHTGSLRASSGVAWSLGGRLSLAVWHQVLLGVGVLLQLTQGTGLHGQANVQITSDLIADMRRFEGEQLMSDHFRVVHLQENSMLIGARNVVYNLSLDTLQENKRITWPAAENDVETCGYKQKTDEECQNYIRVITPTESGEFLVCGTNAFKPWCRKYRDTMGLEYEMVSNESGLAKCPFDPRHNNTALYAGGRFFSATVSDMTARDALIYSENMRTVQHDSQWLNEPDFISSFEYEDKVYFFFRETAVEYINCGKARFSRVARVCKNDKGGARMLRNTWTSFFKARLNCSMPGEYPFYFDELQGTTELGEGNVVPSLALSDSTSMLYAVFSTSQNSISGSAVCAFRFSDILSSFEGPFKEQKTAMSNWLPVKEKETPSPHPAKACVNDTTALPSSTLNFIKTHPLMDKAVPAYGGQPVLMKANLDRHKMTSIAVDWQFHAADGRFYDVLFIGTSNGHVLKAINKAGSGSQAMDTVVIEDIEVLQGGAPVVQLRVYRDLGRGQEKLVVVSQDEVRSIPLHRCHLHTTCSGCVAAQDPYCAWAGNLCAKTNSRSSLQSLETGRHSQCPQDGSTLGATLEPSDPQRYPSSSGCPGECKEQATRQKFLPSTEGPRGARTTTDLDNSIPQGAPEPCVGASVGKQRSGGIYTPSDMAIATILCIVLSLTAGVVAGYLISLWRHGLLVWCTRDACETQSSYQQNTLQKVQNTYEVGPNMPRNDKLSPAPSSPSEKQLNVVYNPLKSNSGKTPNGNVETTVSPAKSKKVYV